MSKCYWPNNSIYFLTGSTFLHFPYFKDYDQKEIVLDQIKKVKNQLGIPVIAYSIAINHYHLKVYLRDGLDLKKIKQLIHGGVSHEYRKHYIKKYKKTWQSSKALVINNKFADLVTTGYIIGNLLKHNEVSTFRELEDNPFSSYCFFKEKHGDEQSRNLVYNVININENAEGIINVKDLSKTKVFKPSTSSLEQSRKKVE
ncbi:transposase [Candidatus Falkowbacteria bacterium]|nr:transposase [Candidatus Falkowbacteria bacterium]